MEDPASPKVNRLLLRCNSGNNMENPNQTKQNQSLDFLKSKTKQNKDKAKQKNQTDAIMRCDKRTFLWKHVNQVQSVRILISNNFRLVWVYLQHRYIHLYVFSCTPENILSLLI